MKPYTKAITISNIVMVPLAVTVTYLIQSGRWTTTRGFGMLAVPFGLCLLYLTPHIVAFHRARDARMDTSQRGVSTRTYLVVTCVLGGLVFILSGLLALLAP